MLVLANEGNLDEEELDVVDRLGSELRVLWQEAVARPSSSESLLSSAEEEENEGASEVGTIVDRMMMTTMAAITVFVGSKYEKKRERKSYVYVTAPSFLVSGSSYKW